MTTKTTTTLVLTLLMACGGELDTGAAGETGETGETFEPASIAPDDGGDFIEALDPSDAAYASGDLADPGQPNQPLAKVIGMQSCQWEKVFGTGRRVTATCDSGSYVVSGGCWQQDGVPGSVQLKRSGPWEISASNQPEHGEQWFEVDGPNGWDCRRTSAHSKKLYANALCCEPESLL